MMCSVCQSGICGNLEHEMEVIYLHITASDGQVKTKLLYSSS